MQIYLIKYYLIDYLLLVFMFGSLALHLRIVMQVSLQSYMDLMQYRVNPNMEKELSYQFIAYLAGLL